MRVRQCGTCSTPDTTNFCDSPTKAVKMTEETAAYCEEADGKMFRQCAKHDCLPKKNMYWLDLRSNQRNHYVVMGWRNDPNNEEKSDMQYVGGCGDFKGDSFLALPLDARDSKYTNNAVLKNKSAFAECMRICAVEHKERCVAVTFFPSLFNGNENCYLHEMRCHEQESFRNIETIREIQSSEESDEQASSISWYAYKDLCNAPRVCSTIGDYDLAVCDSAGDNAFPNLPKCRCSGGKDKNSGYRRFGNAIDIRFYDPASGTYKMRNQHFNTVQQKAPFYSELRSGIQLSKLSIANYEKRYEDGKIACHGMYMMSDVL